MKKIVLTALLIVIIAAGCDSNRYRSDADVHLVKSFENEYSLEGSPYLLTEELYTPTRIYYADSLLFMRESRYEKQMTVFSLKENEIVGELIARGRGPSEMLGAFYFTHPEQSDNVYAYDITLNKLLPVWIDSVSHKDYLPKNMRDLSDFPGIACIAAIDDENFAAIGSFDDARIIRFSLGAKNNESLGENPDLFGNDKISPPVNQAYTGVLKYNRKNDKFVIGCRYADQIEIIDASDGGTMYIKGPVMFEPLYKEVNTGQGPTIGHDNKELFGYVDIICDDNYIYGLFSGREKSDKRANWGNTINVFSWDGNAIARFNLDRDIIAMDIDSANKTIYAISISDDGYDIQRYLLRH